MSRLIRYLQLCLFGLILVSSAAAQNNNNISPKGKFAVGGESVGTVAILRVNVHPSLDGPLLVDVKNAAGAAVAQAAAFPLTLNLPRNRDTAKMQINLAAAGITQVTVTDSNAATETVVINWAPNADYPVASVNEFQPSVLDPPIGGKLWARAERIADKPPWADVKIHIDTSLRGYDLVVKNSKGVVVDRRNFDLGRRTETDFTTQVKLDEGNNTITLTALGSNETATINVPAKTAQFTAAEPRSDDPPEYDWGRVRGYFASGVIFSKERDDFSKSDIFLDFTLDKTYLAQPFGPFKNFNTFFNARLTSVPVTAADAAASASPSPSPSASPAPVCNTADCTAFITSRKAAMMQAGIYLPMYWGFTTWNREVPRLGRGPRLETNALFIAPLAKGGILTTTGQQTAEAKQFGQDDVFNFFSFGAMIGHFRLHGRGRGSKFVADTDVGPELISWLTISRGRWENFEIETPTGLKDAAGKDIMWRQRPWRWEALGRLKIPETPFIIGFDGNFGPGPDDVRFIFGTRFDIGKILHTLRVASAQDTLGQTPAPPSP
jgi:hypothetical protein